MRRLFVLGAVLGVGALSMVVSDQAPAAPSKEAMATARIEKVKDNLYVITGSDASAEKDALLTGGNTAGRSKLPNHSAPKPKRRILPTSPQA